MQDARVYSYDEPIGGVKSQLEQKQIAEMAMLPVKDTREILYRLLKAHFVTLQEVPPLDPLAFWTFVPLTYCTTHHEDAPGILHY